MVRIDSDRCGSAWVMRGRTSNHSAHRDQGIRAGAPRGCGHEIGMLHLRGVTACTTHSKRRRSVGTEARLRRSSAVGGARSYARVRRGAVSGTHGLRSRCRGRRPRRSRRPRPPRACKGWRCATSLAGFGVLADLTVPARSVLFKTGGFNPIQTVAPQIHLLFYRTGKMQYMPELD